MKAKMDQNEEILSKDPDYELESSSQDDNRRTDYRTNVETTGDKDEPVPKTFEGMFLKYIINEQEQNVFEINEPAREPVPVEPEPKRSKCPVCSRILTAAGLKRHELMHAGVNPFHCYVCGKSYSNIDSFRVHQIKHKNERPHQCNICGKTFNLSYVLSAHVRSHTTERPFHCPICTNKYATKAGLYKHKRWHANQSNNTGNPKTGTDLQTETAVKDIPTVGNETNELVFPVIVDNSGNTYTKIDLQTETAVRDITTVGNETNELIFPVIVDNTGNTYTGIDFRTETAVTDLDIVGNKTNNELIIPDIVNTIDLTAETDVDKKVFVDLTTDVDKLELENSNNGIKNSSKGDNEKYESVVSANTVPALDTAAGQKTQKQFKFDCKTCGKVFLGRGSLSNHQKTHTNWLKYQCKVCGKRLHQKYGLKVHMRKHTGERPYPCHLCPYKAATRSVLRRHMRWHTRQAKNTEINLPPETRVIDNEPNELIIPDVVVNTGNTDSEPHGSPPLAQCEVCGKEFIENYRLKVHMRTHTDERPYSCVFCPHRSKTNWDLKLHTTRLHATDLNTSEQCSQLKNPEMESTAKDVPNIELVTPDVVINSGNTGQSFDLTTETDVDSKVFVDLTVDVDKLDEGSVKAKICDKNESVRNNFETIFLKNSNNESRSSSKADDKQNVSVNKKKKYYRCPICLELVTATGLKNHEVIHAEKDPFLCKICRRSFSCQKSLDIHQIKHEKDSEYECNFCGKKFIAKYSLKEHMRTHTGERPYPCTICPYRASTSSCLQKHIKCHTRDNPINLKRAFEKYGHLRNSETDSQTELTVKNVAAVSSNLQKHTSCHTKDNPINLKRAFEKYGHLRNSETDSQTKLTVKNVVDTTSGALKKHIICNTKDNPINLKGAFEKYGQLRNSETDSQTESTAKYVDSDIDIVEHKITIKKEILDVNEDSEIGGNTSKNSDYDLEISSDDDQEENDSVSSPKVCKKYSKCPVCSAYLSATGLRNHEIIHAGKNPFICPICNKTFANRNSFQVHQKLHKKVRPYECEICEKKFIAKYSLKEHMRSHTGERPYHCTFCPHKSTTSGALKKHMRRHTKKMENTGNSNTGSVSQTETIGEPEQFITGNSNTGSVSQETSVKDLGSETNELIIPDVGSNSGNIDSYFKLTTEMDVDKVFVNISIDVDKLNEPSVKAKIGDQNELIRNNFEGIFLKNSLENSSKELNIVPTSEIQSKEWVKCPVCSKFVSATGLRNHELKHKEKNQFYCEICERTYANANSFRTHKKIHTNQRPFVCKVCGQRVTTMASLKVHMRKHTGERPYHCTVCSFKSTNSSSLAKHIRLHSKDSPTNSKRAEKYGDRKNTEIDSQTESIEKEVLDIDIVENKIEHLTVKTEIISEIADDSSVNLNTEVDLQTETTIKKEISDVNHDYDDKIYVLSINADEFDDNTRVKTEICETGENISKDSDYQPEISSEDEPEPNEPISSKKTPPTTGVNRRCFECPVCKRVLSATGLKNHKMLHAGKNPFVCKVCDKEYANEGSFRVHQIKHMNIRPHKCKLCGKKFVHNYNLKEHMRSHTGERPYHCAFCDYKCTTSGALGRHTKRHEEKGDKPRETENISENESTNTSFEIKQEPDVDDGKIFVVSINPNIPNDEVNIKTEIETDESSHKSFEEVLLEGPNYAAESSSKNGSVEPENTLATLEKLRKPFECPVCFEKVSAAGLKCHQRMHSQKESFSCEICGQMYINRKSLIDHKNEHLYECKVCEQKFENNSLLRKHKRTHDKPYQCQLCPYKSSKSIALKNHARAHEKDTLIACEICNVAFVSLGNLNAHQNKAH